MISGRADQQIFLHIAIIQNQKQLWLQALKSLQYASWRFLFSIDQIEIIQKRSCMFYFNIGMPCFYGDAFLLFNVQVYFKLRMLLNIDSNTLMTQNKLSLL